MMLCEIKNTAQNKDCFSVKLKLCSGPQKGRGAVTSTPLCGSFCLF